MEVFIGQNGGKKGPLTLYQIRHLLEEGEIDAETLGWMRDQEDGWKPLGEIPPVRRVIDSIAQDKLDEELAKRPGPQHAPEPLSNPRGITSHAVSRFGARTIDLLMFQSLVLLALYGWPHPPETMEAVESLKTKDLSNFHTSLLLAHFGWQIVEGILLATIGTTPGKWAFQLLLRRPDGAKLDLGVSILRSLYVWVLGMGLGIGVLQIVANVLGFIRIHSRGIMIWDEQLKVQVSQQPLEGARKPFVFVLLVCVTGSWMFVFSSAALAS